MKSVKNKVSRENVARQAYDLTDARVRRQFIDSLDKQGSLACVVGFYVTSQIEEEYGIRRTEMEFEFLF